MRYMIVYKHDPYTVLWVEERIPSNTDIQEILDNDDYTLDDLLLFEVSNEFSVGHGGLTFTKDNPK